MRFKQHINEGYKRMKDGFEKLNDEIHKNCKPYLKLIKGQDPVYRGVQSNYPIGYKNVRKDRQPLGMDKEEADYLNNWLQKNGHTRRDRSMMVTSNYDNLELFGEPCYVFPMGQIKGYSWIGTYDINISDDEIGWNKMTIPAWYNIHTGNRYRGFENQEIMDELKQPFEDLFHTNSRWSYAVKQGYEMWIECDSYIFVQMCQFEWDARTQMMEWRGE